MDGEHERAVGGLKLPTFQSSPWCPEPGEWPKGHPASSWEDDGGRDILRESPGGQCIVSVFFAAESQVGPPCNKVGDGHWEQDEQRHGRSWGGPGACREERTGRFMGELQGLELGM